MQWAVSLFVLSTLAWSGVSSSDIFKVNRPWCFDGHLHFNALSEAKVFYGYDPEEGFVEGHLDTLITDTFASVNCDRLEVDGVNCCTESLTAENIYKVLSIEPDSALTSDQFQEANTFVVTWAFQLNHKCGESETIDWDVLTYGDVVGELMHAFHDHDHDEHDSEHEDEHFGEKLDANPDHDHEDVFTGVDLELLVRAIDANFTPTATENKETYCNQTDAWVVRSREIWRDLHLDHEEEGIAANEVGEMSANLLLYMLHGYCFVQDRVADDGLPLEEDFIKSVFNTFGHDCTIDEHGFDEILELLGAEDDGHAHGLSHRQVGTQEDHDHDHDGPYSDVTNLCLDSHQLQDTFNVDLHRHNLTKEDLIQMAPALIQQVVQGCQHDDTHSGSSGPTDAEKYGYGFLCCFIISLTALLGLVVRKWNHTPAYKYTIVTMLGLASGTLIGDVLLHLIPHAVGLHDHSHDHGDMDISNLTVETYVWKMLCACASIWGFFLLQLGLMEVNERHSQRKGKKSLGSQMNGQVNVGFEPELTNVSMKIEELQIDVESEKVPEKAEIKDDVESMSTEPEREPVAGSVAWLAVSGDAVHKAADGLAIGAAFASDLTLGLSTAIAVFCHEVPHEMGDIAIMLSAGWSVPKVAMLQMATTLAAFAGLLIGIPVSANDEARSWIFIIAAGMFLYVALSNVMPEMVRTYQHYRSTAILVAANVGFVLGIMIMFLIAIFEEYITI